MNGFANVFCFSKDIKLGMRPRACNSLLALPQMEETVQQK